MADGLLMKPGSGADLDLVTAAAGDVLKGKVIVDPEGDPVEGTLELTGNITAADIRKGKTGYSTDPKKPIAGTMAEQAAQTIKPGTSNKTIAANRYLTGVQTIQGDKNLLAKNIIKGVTIFGVAGSAVYAGDTPGYFLEPPKEYEELTGGWETDTYSSMADITYTRGTDAYTITIDNLQMSDSVVAYVGCFCTQNAIVDGTIYRYVYVDYEFTLKNFSTKYLTSVEVAVNAARRIDSTYESTAATAGKKYTTNGTYSGTLKLDVSNVAASSMYRKIKVGIRALGFEYIDGNYYSVIAGTQLKILAVRYDKIQ